jgi:peroxiredoxin
MRRLFGPATALLLAAVVLAGCGGSGGGSSGLGVIDWPGDVADVGAQPGQTAPNFRLEAIDGDTIELASMTGEPMFLNFFASWCVNCREEMEAFEAVSQTGIPVIGIDFQESEDTVRDLVDETGVTFPVALDSVGKVSREYRATSLPVTLLLDAQGRVVEYIRGPVDEQRLEELIATISDGGQAA